MSHCKIKNITGGQVTDKLIMILMQGYLKSIIDTPEIEIRPEDVCALFGNIEEIHDFNRWASYFYE